MPDKGLIQINISRIIPGGKWEVVRQLTKVEEFSNYVPCVKESSVIKKGRNVIRTKWKIEVEKIPVSWVEEDVLMLTKDTIYFKAVEGDLEEFWGRWEFLNNPQGTEIKVSVYLKVGIPIIENFAAVYLKRVLARNFEAILEFLEKKLIAGKYASFKNGRSKKVSGFGLIGHFFRLKHFEELLSRLKSGSKMPSEEFISRVFQAVPYFDLGEVENFTSLAAEKTSGCFIMPAFVPQMVKKDPWAVFSKLVKACQAAERKGIGIVALAGLAFLAEEESGGRVSDEVNVTVTYGDAFTAAVSLDNITSLAKSIGLDLQDARLAVVGCTTKAAAACIKTLAGRVKELILFSSDRRQPAYLRKELLRAGRAKIIIASNIPSSVKNADIVVLPESSVEPVLDINWCKEGAIVCDAGYTRGFYGLETGKAVSAFAVGLAKFSGRIKFPIDMRMPAENLIYSAFAEAIILALEQRYENVSLAGITPEVIEYMRVLGRKHGFEPAYFQVRE